MEEKLTFEINQCVEVSLQLANLNTGCQHKLVLPPLTSGFSLPFPHQRMEHQEQRQMLFSCSISSQLGCTAEPVPYNAAERGSTSRRSSL